MLGEGGPGEEVVGQRQAVDSYTCGLRPLGEAHLLQGGEQGRLALQPRSSAGLWDLSGDLLGLHSEVFKAGS